ncbi:exodeoxyribonuclease VII small subunit [Longirhabdus pacifica]|uniref:exodeoxyribonuclease VII small subunit n=1 Tax=Longirhabdus pacifica TaxID=2305227 RepID=UPI001008A449|nr:exodeoxyribonuclease VII small subunit [Longirhabdus pacifica]
MDNNETNDIKFEQAMDKLEKIVAQLEDGDVPLEEAIDLFQQGMKLAKLCSDKLENVEKKMELIMETDEGLMKKPFELPNE